MKTGKRNKKIPLEILAACIANREIEQKVFGDGFHARTRIKKSKKVYCRKKKHPEQPTILTRGNNITA